MPITTDTEALAEFDRLCPRDVCPTLTPPEAQRILDQRVRASLWESTTLYHLGSVVIPTLANRTGHRYRLIAYTDTGTDQLSGATEPDWTTSRDSSIEDNHLTWREDGDDYGAVLWDFTSAARDGWNLKAAKASPTSDFETDTLKISSSQLFDHCIRMAATFQPVYCL